MDSGEQPRRYGRERRRNFYPGLFLGLLLILIGAVYYLYNAGYTDSFWAWFLVGLGIIIIIVRILRHPLRPGIFPIIMALICITAGMSMMGNVSYLWLVVLIVLGLVVVLHGILRR